MIGHTNTDANVEELEALDPPVLEACLRACTRVNLMPRNQHKTL